MGETLEIAFAMLITATVAIVVLREARKRRSARDQVEAEELLVSYPRLPGAMDRPPDWLLAETDPPYDLKTFFAPIPPEQNAAPLYLEALTEFGGEMAVCFRASEQAAIWARSDARVRAFEEVYDPGLGRVRPGADRIAIDRVVAAFEPGFQKIALAQLRPRCAFQIVYTDLTMPHGNVFRRVAAVALLRIERDLRAGEVARPIQTVEMLLRITRDLEYQGVLLAQIFVVALQRVVKGLVTMIVDAPGITTWHVDYLIDVLVRHERESLPHPHAEGVRMEYVLERCGLHDIELRTGNYSREGLVRVGREWRKKFRTVGEFLEGAAKMGLQIGRLETAFLSAREYDARLRQMTAVDYQREAVLFVRYCREAIAVAELPFPQQASRQNRLVELQSSSLLLPATWGIYPRTGAVCARGRAATRAALCLAAVRRWNSEYAEPPPDLESVLIAAGIESPQIDPFTDQPLRMANVNGEPQIIVADPDGLT